MEGRGRGGGGVPEECGPDVDLVHEVELLCGRAGRVGEADGTRVVHEKVDAAEVLRGLFDGANDRLLRTHVERDREGPTARRLHCRHTTHTDTHRS